jgi:ribonuclease G
MPSEILINSSLREIRVALMENNQLSEIFIEHRANKGIVGNIYKGEVTKVLPGMQAAFVDIGLEKAGFLCAGDIDITDILSPENTILRSKKYAPTKLNEKEINLSQQDETLRSVKHNIPIQELLKEGQEIIVQVAKNQLGTKGARITSYIAIPGRYLVYMPTITDIFVSRRIEDDGEKERLKTIVSEIGNLGEGYIIRTAGQNCEKNDFAIDLKFLHRLWGNLQKNATEAPPCHLLYEDMNLTFRSMRDLFTNDVNRIVVDSKLEYQNCLEFCESYLPHILGKIELYRESTPIFEHFGVEIEINRALDRKVWLKSGGYISIDQTEALVAVDVNTGKFIGKSDQEETILKTNLEAVKEVVYQLRLRNIGGIIIVDFIDMLKEENKEIIWNALIQSLKSDRSRTKILKISELGLVQMTRKRVRESLSQILCDTCDYCGGKGHNRSATTVCNEIIRSIQRICTKNHLNQKNLSIVVHPLVYDLFFEEENLFLEELEQKYCLEIKFIVSDKLHQEKYNLVLK